MSKTKYECEVCGLQLGDEKLLASHEKGCIQENKQLNSIAEKLNGALQEMRKNGIGLVINSETVKTQVFEFVPEYTADKKRVINLKKETKPTISFSF
mgnify:CR=1 FL=1